MRRILSGFLPWVILLAFLVGYFAVSFAWDEGCKSSLERCSIYRESTSFFGG